jgi:nucleotide-binding universal stress UspA family protein
VGDLHELETAALNRIRHQFAGEGLRGPGIVPVVTRSDEPHDEIVTYARTADVDLIVMGTHGRTGLAHLLMGSIAEKVVRAAPCPVLTVHGARDVSAAGFRRILVPTDFGAASDTALHFGRILAGRFGASLHLMHVLEDLQVDQAIGPEVFATESPEARSARLRDARERLKHRISARDRGWLRATTEVLFGPPANMIADYAGDNDFDLIVMGTHGRKGMAHLLMGSVAERVVRTAACPVMTVHHVCKGLDMTAPGENARKTA